MTTRTRRNVQIHDENVAPGLRKQTTKNALQPKQFLRDITNETPKIRSKLKINHKPAQVVQKEPVKLILKPGDDKTPDMAQSKNVNVKKSAMRTVLHPTAEKVQERQMEVDVEEVVEDVEYMPPPVKIDDTYDPGEEFKLDFGKWANLGCTGSFPHKSTFEPVELPPLDNLIVELDNEFKEMLEKCEEEPHPFPGAYHEDVDQDALFGNLSLETEQDIFVV